MSLFIPRSESPIIRRVDVLVTPEASLDLRALMLLRPKASAWGLLIGHRRGRRVFVERFFPGGAGAVLPRPGRLDEIDRGLGRRLVGFYSVRPSAAFKKSLLAPYFYGRLFFDIRAAKGGPGIRPFVIEFDRVFSFFPVGLAPGPKGRKR
jgi:hypothetical protein